MRNIDRAMYKDKRNGAALDRLKFLRRTLIRIRFNEDGSPNQCSSNLFTSGIRGLNWGQLLERNQSGGQLPEHHSETVDVDLPGASLVLDHLRGHPAVRPHAAAASGSSVLRGLRHAGGAKVSDFDSQVAVEEQVIGLEVSVDDPLRVEVLHSPRYVQRQPQNGPG